MISKVGSALVQATLFGALPLMLFSGCTAVVRRPLPEALVNNQVHPIAHCLKKSTLFDAKVQPAVSLLRMRISAPHGKTSMRVVVSSNGSDFLRAELLPASALAQTLGVITASGDRAEFFDATRGVTSQGNTQELFEQVLGISLSIRQLALLARAKAPVDWSGDAVQCLDRTLYVAGSGQLSFVQGDEVVVEWRDVKDLTSVLAECKVSSTQFSCESYREKVISEGLYQRIQSRRSSDSP